MAASLLTLGIILLGLFPAPPLDLMFASIAHFSIAFGV